MYKLHFPAYLRGDSNHDPLVSEYVLLSPPPLQEILVCLSICPAMLSLFLAQTDAAHLTKKLRKTLIQDTTLYY